jgi:uncharacterized protein (DUF169 family)
MTPPDWNALAERLTGALDLAAAPVAITFSAAPPAGVPRFAEPMSAPSADGRQGRVPSSCVFWMRGATSTFSTVPEIAANDDAAELLGSGWVTARDTAGLPSVAGRPGAVTYGPLGETPPGVRPDVVLLRVNGHQLMVLSDTIPGLLIGGKPQCHIVALAKEQRLPAASVGCALSRVRTGMPPEEMTCALPAADLEALVAAVERTAATNSTVAAYAASDARRFPS